MLKFVGVRQRQVVCTLTIFCLVLGSRDVLSQSAGAGANGNPIDYAAIQSGIDNLTAALEKTRSNLKRASFEPSALVDSLDYDADAVIGYVRDSIVYQPYQGTLRGVDGTLRAGAGNSLDQAMLLANLLKTAGLDARIVHGRLSETDALRLLRGTRQATPGNSLDYLQKTLVENFGEPAGQAPQAVEWSKTGLAEEAGQLIDAVTLSLRNAGVGLADTDAGDKWLPIAMQYFWVQYRDGPSQGWQDVHPAFASAPPPHDAQAEKFFTESVPAEYQHLLTVSAWIGQWLAGKIENHQIMSPWTRPVANLDAQTIRYRNSPNGLNQENAGDLSAVVGDTQFLVPMFNDATAPGAMAFDLKGRIVDPMALGGNAGIFQTMGDKMAAATGDLMDREDKQPAMALDSMWLEFTFTAPGGTQTTYRRYLVAPRTDHGTDASKLLWPLLTSHSYQVNAGGQPLDYLAERFLVTAIDDQAWLSATIEKFREPGKRMAQPEVAIPADFPTLAQYRFMDDNPFAQAGVVSYRATPSLLGLLRGYRDADTAFAAVDIIANHVEHLRVADKGLQQAPAAGLARGVWDTVLENVPQKALRVDQGASASTVTVFEKAAGQDIPIKVLKPGTTDSLAAFGLDANASAFVQADLDKGYLVVLPEKLPDGVGMAGWWRVDPVSGATLGMTGDGRGQDVVEYLTEVVGIAFNMVQALQSLKDCDKQANDVAKMCCLVEANINNVAGLGFGSLLGATVGTAGGALFDILNYATTGVTGGQGLMPTAKLGCEKMQATDW